MRYQIVKKQRGLSFWGFVWSSVVIISISYLLIIGIPTYINNAKLSRALNDLASDPRIMVMPRIQMVRSLERKLNIDMADTVVNLNRTFQVKSIGGKKDLSLDYEVVIPVFYNVSLLFDFKNHVLAPIN